MAYYGWKPYVSVGTRLARAEREMQKLRKKGVEIQPIKIEKRKIATTFWGQSWCDHIESFSDFANRVPRGRTYVRNGSVCHLTIAEGEINAFVAGSEIYQVTIAIKPLPTKKWQAIKVACSGKIASLIDLLSGKLSNGVMTIVCHQQTGLFPLPTDIHFSCSCPDWATMCKHVAAVLYGVGTRLDHLPQQLFHLRAVSHEELIDISAAITETTQQQKGRATRLTHSALSDLFDIELTDAKTPAPNNFPKYLTGVSLRKQRLRLKLTQMELAKSLSVSTTTISRWENIGRARIRLTEKNIRKLHKIWQA